MRVRTEKKTITQAEYLQLLGLKTLAKFHWDAINSIEKAARQITGEEDGGHTDDMIGGDRQLDEALELLGITVLK